MRYIGVHVSIAGGVYRALQRARALDVNTVQIFLKNAKKWSSPQFKDKEIDRFFAERKKFNDIRIFAHTGYLVNLASRGLLFKRSYKSLIDDFRRADSLGIEDLILHPGNHNGKGVSKAVDRIARALNRVFKRMTHTNIRILLETTSGNGTSVGYRFEHLRDIIDKSKYSERIGVCLDTCHIFAAGYPISDPDGFHRVIDDFDRIIGIERLKLIHLNDTKGKLGSRLDRHEHIGRGLIGDTGFQLLLNDDRLKDIPIVLETPKIIGEMGPNIIAKDIPMILETSRKLGFTIPDTILKDIPERLQTSKRIAIASSEIIFKEILKTLDKVSKSGAVSRETDYSLAEVIRLFREARQSGVSIPYAMLKRIQRLMSGSINMGSSISENMLRQVLKILKSTRQTVYEVDMMNLKKIYSLIEN